MKLTLKKKIKKNVNSEMNYFYNINNKIYELATLNK